MAVRKARGISWLVLRMTGFDGVYAPDGHVYIMPEHWTHGVLRKQAAPLVRHELMHAQQCKRYGWFGFWWRCIWYVIRYGYDKSPFEIEARAAERCGA